MRRTGLIWWGAGALILAVVLGAALTAAGPDVPTAVDAWWNELMIQARPPFLIVFSHVMNRIGGGWIASIVVPLVVAAALLLARRWRAAVFALIVFIASAAVVQLLKEIFGRARPEEMLVLSDFGSFPSGHTANAATIAAVLWMLFPRLWTALVGVLWIVAMAVSRTVLSVHWLTDTVGGALVGASVALLLGALLLPWAQRRHEPAPVVDRVE